MSEARKCDRCHRFYEIPKEQQDKCSPYELKGAYAKLLFCDNNRNYPESVRWYDLCPKCVELLDKWLENPDNYEPQDLVKDIVEEYDRVIKSGDRRAIAHFKNKHGYTMTKEEIDIVNEDVSEPFYKDPCKSCHNGKCEQCIYGYCSEEEKKNRWLGNHRKKNVDDDERVNNLYKEAEEISNNAGDTKEEEK